MAITSAIEWRKPRVEGFEFVFASGQTAFIRPIQVDFFFRVGHIPEPLVDVVLSALNNQSYRIEVPRAEQMVQMREWIAFLNELCHYAFVSPEVRLEEGDEPLGDNEITVDDISYQSKLQLYMYFTRPAEFLARFRPQQISNVGAVDAATTNGHSSQPTPESQSDFIATAQLPGRVDGDPVRLGGDALGDSYRE